MYENKPVRLLYIVPVHLSANAVKQNKFELDMLLSWMTFTFAVQTAMLSNLSLSSSLSIIGTTCLWRGTTWRAGASSSVGTLCCVLRRSCRGCFMWPLAEARLGLRYLVTPFAMRLGHPLRYPQWITFSKVDKRGLQRDWWAKQILLALFRTVCVKKAICVVAKWAWASAITGAADGIAMGLQWVDVLGVPIGRVYKSVVLSLSPSNIILLLYQMVHLNLLKQTLHPASVKTWIPNKEVIESSGIMCPVRIVGKPTMLTSHLCVDNTLRPSARATFRGKCVILLLITGVPSMMKIWVAPESAIGSFVLRAK